MKLKQIIKIISLSVGSLILITLVYSIIPRVFNPSPEFQTELSYVIPIDKQVDSILTPFLHDNFIMNIIPLHYTF